MAQISKWLDITDQITQAAKNLKLFQVVSLESFNLQESMQANEINDYKIDAKSDFGIKSTLKYLIQNKIVKHPDQIQIQEAISIYDQILGYQMLSFNGQPLAQSIYTFPYLYDKKLVNCNQYILGLIQSINTFGSYASQIIRTAYSTKQDDMNFSMYSFSNDKKSPDQIIEILLKLQKQLEQTRIKQKVSTKQLNIYDGLAVRIRFRRFLHLLTKSLGLKFQYKNVDKIQKEIQSCRKKLDDVKKYQKFYKKTQNIFNSQIFKSLRTHISPRIIVYPQLNNTFKQVENFFQQITLLLPLPKVYTQILEKLQILSRMPSNTLSKSYIIASFFAKQEHLMGYQPTLQAVVNDIVDWTGAKQGLIKSENFIILAKQCSTLVNEILYRNLANKMRWYWQTSKLYEQMNLLVHFGNQFDKNYGQSKKQFYICSWIYYIGVNNMIKQLHIGIEIDLYYPIEFPYIFYYLDYLLNVVDKNSNTFLSKFDPLYIKAFNEKTLDNKRKKKVSSNTRKLFSYNIYHKGLSLYYKALYKLLFVFMTYGALPNDFKNMEQERYKARFKIFKKIIFLKGVDYASYKKQYDTYQNLQTCQKNLQSGQEHLKQAKNIFQSLSIFESGDINLEYKKNSEDLVKICIRLSLQVMKFKMKKDIAKNLKLIKSNTMFAQFTF